MCLPINSAYTKNSFLTVLSGSSRYLIKKNQAADKLPCIEISLTVQLQNCLTQKKRRCRMPPFKNQV